MNTSGKFDTRSTSPLFDRNGKFTLHLQEIRVHYLSTPFTLALVGVKS